jgi:hypothetical protein
MLVQIPVKSIFPREMSVNHEMLNIHNMNPEDTGRIFSQLFVYLSPPRSLLRFLFIVR